VAIFGSSGGTSLKTSSLTGKNFQPMIANYTDVKFASVNVLLGDDVVEPFFMDELDAFLELLVCLD
jgi:hypothetical protein